MAAIDHVRLASLFSSFFLRGSLTRIIWWFGVQEEDHRSLLHLKGLPPFSWPRCHSPFISERSRYPTQSIRRCKIAFAVRSCNETSLNADRLQIVATDRTLRYHPRRWAPQDASSSRRSVLRHVVSWQSIQVLLLLCRPNIVHGGPAVDCRHLIPPVTYSIQLPI